MQSLSLATDRVKRILTLMKSQNVAIYNKKEPCRKPAPFDKGAKNMVLSVAKRRAAVSRFKFCLWK